MTITPAYDDVLDNPDLGVDYHLTWRQNAELMRLLEQAAQNEEALGWSARSLRRTIALLHAQRSEQAKRRHPSAH